LATGYWLSPGVDDDLGRWRFCRFDHAGHRIALAVEAAAVGPPEVFEVRPPLGLPTRLALDSPAWFSVSVTKGSGRDA